MTSLNNFPDLKKQLQLFLETEVIPAIIIATHQGNTRLVINLIQGFKSKINGECDESLSALETLLEKLINPGDDFGFDEPLLKVDEFKELYTILCKDKVLQLLAKNYSNVSKVDIRVMTAFFTHAAYYILDEQDVISLMKLAKKNLHIDILTKEHDMLETVYSLSLYLSLFEHFQTDYD